MNKLVELLNERQQSFAPGYEFTYQYCEESAKEELDKLSELKTFIKWLVDNDKIDLKKISRKELATGWNLENNILDEENTKESWIKFWTECLLMLLAIQDEPIEFLISILK